MKTTGFNYRHLYFFWVVAKEGGVTRAAERLGLAVQTISTQLALLEKELGKSLLQPQGRRLVPTEAGRLALGYADRDAVVNTFVTERMGLEEFVTFVDQVKGE